MATATFVRSTNWVMERRENLCNEIDHFQTIAEYHPLSPISIYINYGEHDKDRLYIRNPVQEKYLL